MIYWYSDGQSAYSRRTHSEFRGEAENPYFLAVVVAKKSGGNDDNNHVLSSHQHTNIRSPNLRKTWHVSVIMENNWCVEISSIHDSDSPQFLPVGEWKEISYS